MVKAMLFTCIFDFQLFFGQLIFSYYTFFSERLNKLSVKGRDTLTEFCYKKYLLHRLFHLLSLSHKIVSTFTG